MRVEHISNENYYIRNNQIETNTNELKRIEKSDSVEISQLGKMLSQLKKIEDIRESKVDDIKKKILTKGLLQPPNVRNGILRMLILTGQLPLNFEQLD